MTSDIAIVVIVFAAAVALFVSERLRVDLVALPVLLAPAVGGIAFLSVSLRDTWESCPLTTVGIAGSLNQLARANDRSFQSFFSVTPSAFELSEPRLLPDGGNGMADASAALTD